MVSGCDGGALSQVVVIMDPPMGRNAVAGPCGGRQTGSGATRCHFSLDVKQFTVSFSHNKELFDTHTNTFLYICLEVEREAIPTVGESGWMQLVHFIIINLFKHWLALLGSD